MLFHRTPNPPLSEFVELLWLFEKPLPTHGRERVLPTGTIELVINLNDRACGGFEAIVAGPHSRFFELDTRQPASIVGVHFKPGGAFPFFTQPLDELHNIHVSLDALWRRRAAEIRELVMAAGGTQARLLMLECALTDLLPAARRRHAAVTQALAAFSQGARRIADVVEESGLTSRRFIRLFKDEVGLTPKAFCRIRRFQSTLAALHGRDDVDWADTAVACGYYDQSHLIHDFQDFAGLSPASYLSRRTEHMNHVPR